MGSMLGEKQEHCSNLQHAKNAKCESEIHDFIDSLCKESFYGELIFYFQKGNIEYCRTVSRIPKNEIIKKVQSQQKKKTSTCKEVNK